MIFEKRMWKIFSICVGIGLCSGIFDWRYATGILLGSFVAIINWIRTVLFWSDVLASRHATKFTGIFHFAISYALMAMSLFLCIKFSQYLNIYACTIALLFIKITLIVNEMTKRKEDVQ